MNQVAIKVVHWSFWLIGILALLWNIGGAINYLMQTNPDFVATLPDTHRAIIEARPVWATGGFAIGVFGGALACLLLLFRKSVSLYLFIASLLGIIVTMIHTVQVATSKIEFNVTEIIVMVILPVLVAMLLIWYTRLANKKGWLR